MEYPSSFTLNAINEAFSRSSQTKFIRPLPGGSPSELLRSPFGIGDRETGFKLYTHSYPSIILHISSMELPYHSNFLQFKNWK